MSNLESSVPSCPGGSAETPGSSPAPMAIDELTARCMGNTAIATLLLQKFEQQLRVDIVEIEQCVAAGDASKVAHTAHTLKGAAGTVAASALRDIAAEIESHSRQQQLDAVTLLLADLRAEVDRCLAYIPAGRSAVFRSPTIKRVRRIPADRRIREPDREDSCR